MSLRDDILAAFPTLTAKTRDDKEIADALSAGRVKITSVIGGLPKFVEILGVADALAYLSKATDPATIDFWLVESLRDVRCDLGAPGFIAMAAAANLSDPQRNTLMAALTVPDPITEQHVAVALAGFDDPPVMPDEKPVVIEAEPATVAIEKT